MSKANIQSVRGMRDVLPPTSQYFEQVIDTAKRVVTGHGYVPFVTPILEETRLFARAVGEGTDVVEKEMFTFGEDDDSLTLRPEGTAGMVRAAIQHGQLFGTTRFWQVGPMFRRERPQKGRYRQFVQFDVESFGIADASLEVELMLIHADIFQALGLADDIKLEINSILSHASRQQYREALVEYLTQRQDDLDEDSQRRLGKNPLRILDSKNPAMRDVIAQAPVLSEFADDESKRHFDRVLSGLSLAKIDYTLNPKLVRGLDYYNHTVFEWTTNTLGAQGTVSAGGRYDGLAETLGGQSVPGAGFAMGVDRLVLMLEHVSDTPKFSPTLAYVALLGEETKMTGLGVARALRQAFPDEVVLCHLHTGGMKKQLEKANQANCRYAVIIGESELEDDTVTVKNMRTGEQAQVSQTALVDKVKEFEQK